MNKHSPVSEEEVAEDLEFLRDLGLIEQTPDGRWRKTVWAAEIGSEVGSRGSRPRGGAVSLLLNDYEELWVRYQSGLSHCGRKRVTNAMRLADQLTNCGDHEPGW